MTHFVLSAIFAIDQNNWIPAAVFGGLLFVGGLLMMHSHRKAWFSQRDDSSLDSLDRAHFTNRYQRRMQVSGGISFIGVMVAVGDQPVIWNLGPLASTLYWIFVLILACWVGVLAYGDMTSIRTYSSVAQAKVDTQRRRLESEIARLKNQPGSQDSARSRRN